MKHSKSSLLLMELVICILFFSLSSIVCIRLFARAHHISVQTVNENHALIQAQNLAELFLAADGSIEQMQSLSPDYVSEASQNSFSVWFSADWEQCDRDQICYTASLTAFPEENGLVQADITVYANDTEQEPIYTLRLSHHPAQRRGDLD